MFNTCIVFEVEKRHIGVVSGRLGEFCVTVNFGKGGILDRSKCRCTAKVRLWKYDKCMDEIVKLMNEGFSIKGVVTV